MGCGHTNPPGALGGGGRHVPHLAAVTALTVTLTQDPCRCQRPRRRCEPVRMRGHCPHHGGWAKPHRSLRPARGQCGPDSAQAATWRVEGGGCGRGAGPQKLQQAGPPGPRPAAPTAAREAHCAQRVSHGVVFSKPVPAFAEAAAGPDTPSSPPEKQPSVPREWCRRPCSLSLGPRGCWVSPSQRPWHQPPPLNGMLSLSLSTKPARDPDISPLL